MIALTFLLHEDQQHPNRCEILLDSYCDHTTRGHEAEIAEQITIAALRTLRLEQRVCVVREGSRTTVKGKLSLITTSRGGPQEAHRAAMRPRPSPTGWLICFLLGVATRLQPLCEIHGQFILRCRVKSKRGRTRPREVLGNHRRQT